MKLKSLKAGVGLAVVAIVAGCASIEPATIDAQDEMDALTEDSLSYGARPEPVVKRFEGSWAAGRVVPLVQKDPVELLQSHSFYTSQEKGLWEIASYLTELTGLPVQVSPDVFISDVAELAQAAALQAAGSDFNSDGADTVLDALDGSLGTGTDGAVDTSNSPISAKTKMTYDFEGSVKHFLDFVSARYGLTWRYEASTIVVSRRITQTFDLLVAAGVEDSRATIGGSAALSDDTLSGGASATSGSSSANGDINQALSYYSKDDRWNSYIDVIENMLSPIGDLSDSPSLGTVSITDIPYVMNQIEKTVNEFNKSLSRQTYVEVTVITASSKDKSSYGIDWEFLRTSGSTSQTLTVPGLGDGLNGTTTLGLKVIDPTSKLANTELFLRALESRNKITSIKRHSAQVLNNRAATIQVSTTDGYLRSIETTVNETSTTESRLPGAVTTGLFMTVKPRILQGNDILLRYSLDLSNLRSFTREGGPTNQISIPNTDRSATMNEVMVEDGVTMVVSGLVEQRATLDKSGTGHPDNLVMGRRTADLDAKETIILVRPIIVGERNGRQG